MLEFFKVSGVSFNCLLAEKDNSESDSNDKVNLFRYCITCGVDFPFLIELELLLQLYSYHYSYRP